MGKFFLFIALLFTITVHAQDFQKTKALSFSFNGLNLSEFYGGIGGKVYLNETIALSTNIGFDKRTRTTEGTATRTEGIDKNWTTTIGIGIEKHFAETENLSPYFTGRLTGSYNESEYRYSQNIPSQIYFDMATSRSIAVEMGLGLEYWVSKRISIAGQHLIRFVYGTGTNQYYGLVEAQKNITRGVETGTSSLILAIYF